MARASLNEYYEDWLADLDARLAERALNPVVGKSLVVYAVKRGEPSDRRG